MPELTIEQINDLWDAGEARRADGTVRKSYYDGKHAITERKEKYSDGNWKTNRVTNWTQAIVDRYVGSMTKTAWQVTRDNAVPSEVDEAVVVAEEESGEEESESLSIQQYGDIARDQNLAAVDSFELRNSLIFGDAIEVHSFDDAEEAISDKTTITPYDPREWVIVRNTDETMVAAIRRVTLKQGTILDDVYLEQETEIMTVYTDATITTYEARGDDAKNPWVATEIIPHFYERVPVVQWRATPERTTILSDAIIGQNDEWNEIDSGSGDTIKQIVEAFLLVSNVDANWLTDEAAALMKKRILSLSGDADAKYLLRPTDTEPVKARLERVRDAIHMMGKIPDVAEIIGATGATSGIALELMFTPQQESASAMIPYLREGMRERIDLINAMLERQGLPIIENYEVTIQFVIPVNRIEEWKNIGALRGVVSKLTLLKLLSDIDDPEGELQAVRKELDAGFVDADEVDGATAAVAQDDRIAQGALAAQPQIQELVEVLSQGALDFFQQSGALERAVANAARDAGAAQETGQGG